MAAAPRRFEDRGAVVTGGATGIGGAIAERLASEGASVLIADINAQGARERAARIQDAGGTAAACTTNVGELDQVQAMIQAAVDRWGRLDIIVNNAYPALEAMTGGAEDVPPDVYDRAMAVLVKASYLSAKFGVPHLRVLVAAASSTSPAFTACSSPLAPSSTKPAKPPLLPPPARWPLSTDATASASTPSPPDTSLLRASRPTCGTRTPPA